MKKALFYQQLKNETVRCNLCPHACIIEESNQGSCGVRINKLGELYSEVYGKVSALNSDPIEKKPLYHYYPGKNILSIGSIGCNFKCKFCQNWEISQQVKESMRSLQDFSPESIIELALKRNSFGIAYTYNEPSVWYEFMLDTAKISHNYNLKNVVVSNGYINENPLQELLNFIDAFNIDLKAFENDFYKKYLSATIEPVKSSLEIIKNSGKHLEMTNLIIPGLNDDPETFLKMAKWISENLGKDTVLHLSRYFPTYKFDIESTPLNKLFELFDIAKSELYHVYIGNVNADKGKNSYCSKCGNLIIRRTGYNTNICSIDENGKCTKCGQVDIKCC